MYWRTADRLRQRLRRVSPYRAQRAEAEALRYRKFAPKRTYRAHRTYHVSVWRPALLWILLFLFALRVVGQLLVVAGVAPFLPPMEEWQSGLLPYPALLTSQMVILALLTIVCLHFSRNDGYFVRHHAWLATPLWITGWMYAIGMIVRYALLRRDAIPVVFHMLLASFLLVVASHHRRQG